MEGCEVTHVVKEEGDHEFPDAGSGRPVDTVVINEIQLLLAEKRTYLALLRTGIAVIVLPLSLISFLIATSQHYQVVRVWPLLVPVLIACFLLVVFGVLLIRSALLKLRHAERMIHELKAQNAVLARFVD